MYVVIDSGSISTRLYLLQSGNENVIDKLSVDTGVNATITHGNNNLLRESISEGIKALLARNKLAESDITFIIAAGMITSNLGLKEIPHLIAPLSVAELARQTQRFSAGEILALSIPVILVPGIRNAVTRVDWNNLRSIDLMRGEETQAAGILLRYQPKLPFTIVELGSTTKIININHQGQINGSITSLSGQVYAAILKETFLSSSVREPEETSPPDYFDETIVDAACHSVACSGFLRTLLMTRFIQFSLPSTAAQRRLFLQSAIAADDMKLFSDAEHQQFSLQGEIFFVGHPERCRLYRYVTEKHLNLNSNFSIISDSTDIDMLAITGARHIAECIQTGH